MIKYKWTNRIILSILILALVAMSGCENKNDIDFSLAEHVAKYSTMEPGDMEYISRNTTHNVPYELDMTHDAQYRYILHNLREGGDSPEKSPGLYQYLRNLREGNGKKKVLEASYFPQVQSDSKPKVAKAWLNVDKGEVADAGLSDINLLTALYSEDQVNYTAEGVSSIYGGTSTTTMTFNFRTAQTPTPFYYSPTYKAHGSETEHWTQTTTGAVPTSQSGEDVIASMTIIPSPSALSTGAPITMSSEDKINASDQCVTAPNYGTTQNAGTAPCPPSTSTCVNKNTVTQVIVSCYGRNNQQAGMCGNCNYGYDAPGHPDSLALMVSGTIDFPSNIVADALGNPQGQVQMYLQQKNGGCILKSQYNDGVPLPSQFTINPSNPKQLMYCFKGGDFTSKSCFKDLVHSTIDLNMTVFVIVENSGSGTNYAQAQVSSNNCKSIGKDWCANIPEICIVQGCLAKGTQITLSDGTKKAVEEFTGGEMVLSSGEHKIVGATTMGNEWMPMHRIKTENGKEVFISGKHAVPTSDGMKLALNLKVGDELTTDEGPSKIASIENEMYEETVHNFTVGEETHASEGVANMYANGILVGDLTSQQYYTMINRTSKKTLEELKQEVDEAYHIDVENDFKSRQ